MTRTSSSSGAKKRKAKPRRGPKVEDFPFPWRWWNGDPYVRALTDAQRGKLADTLHASVDTPTPGMMTEEEVRCRMHLTPDEWAAQRSQIEPVFTLRSDGRWVQREFRASFLCQFERISVRRKASQANARKLWKNKAIAASGDASGMPRHDSSGCHGIHTRVTPSSPGVASESETNTVPSSAAAGGRPRDAAAAPEPRLAPDGRDGSPRVPLPRLVGTLMARVGSE